MNFTPYIGKPVVLIKNEVSVQKELQNFSIKLIRLTHNNQFSIIFTT